MSERPTFTVEYIEPVEAEPLPDEFSAPRLRALLGPVDRRRDRGHGGDRAPARPGLAAEPLHGCPARVARAGRGAPARVLRGLCSRVPGRVLPAHELAYQHGDRAVRAGGELGALDRWCGRARPWCVDPAARRTPWLVHRAAHGGV